MNIFSLKRGEDRSHYFIYNCVQTPASLFVREMYPLRKINNVERCFVTKLLNENIHRILKS